MAGNLTAQVAKHCASLATAVAERRPSKKINVDVKGEIAELKNTVNTMVDQLSLFRFGSDARGARSGLGRILGGQAEVKGVAAPGRI